MTQTSRCDPTQSKCSGRPAPKTRIARAVDLAHSSRAKIPANFVLPQPAARSNSHKRRALVESLRQTVYKPLIGGCDSIESTIHVNIDFSAGS
jgi:hypothetical protein